MSMSAVLLVSLAAAVVLVVGGGLMMYMSNLVKNAYELKVQINSDVDERIKAISDDVEKRAKWIKRDVVEELDKIKSNLVQSNTRTIAEMSEPFSKRLEAIEQILQKERADWSSAVDETRQGGTQLDAKLAQLRKDVRKIEEKLGMIPTSATGGTPPKPSTGEETAPGAEAGAAKPAGPVNVGAVLPSL